MAPDCLHLKHLGTDQYLLGSVLELLCRQMLPNSLEDNAEQVLHELQQEYQASLKLNTVPFVMLHLAATTVLQFSRLMSSGICGYDSVV